MCNLFFYKNLTIFFFLIISAKFYCQSNYAITVSTSDEECIKGAASISIDGLTNNDTLNSLWSNNTSNSSAIDNLIAGDYFIHVIIKHKLDTTIYFEIHKKECEVKISNHFTPNGDNYNDYLQISNIHNYPKFELFIFNKWGQQVHYQKGTYTPWDGSWNGINLPDQTYYFVFYYNADNKNKLLKGDITLLR